MWRKDGNATHTYFQHKSPPPPLAPWKKTLLGPFSLVSLINCSEECIWYCKFAQIIIYVFVRKCCVYVMFVTFTAARRLVPTYNGTNNRGIPLFYNSYVQHIFYHALAFLATILINLDKTRNSFWGEEKTSKIRGFISLWQSRKIFCYLIVSLFKS